MERESKPALQAQVSEQEYASLQGDMSDDLLNAIRDTSESDLNRYQQTILAAMTALDEERIVPGIPTGSAAPTFTLPDLHDRPVDLETRLADGPVLLTFYRGSWCPVCSTQLRALQSASAEMRDKGCSLIAVSPQAPDESLAFVTEAGIDFDVLTDGDHAVAARYRILFDLPDVLRPIYEHFGTAPTSHNADRSWRLPVPATFVIDRNGIVRSRHVNPRYWERMQLSEIREALAGLE